MSNFNSKKVADHISSWLNKYIADLPVNGFIVGVSGGVDSAVVAHLCAQTNKEVLLLNLPIYQSKPELDRAQKQIEELKQKFSNVSGVKLDLTSVFDVFTQTMPKNTRDHQLSMANSRARLRMTVLYAMAQPNQLLVVGTGNKIEDLGIGFFTKFGDGAADLNPIGDLLKSEVYLLAQHLGVIEEIIEAQPTDGLWGDHRIDEDQIGATYDEIEFAMNYKGTGEDLSKRQKEVLKIYKHLHKINQHKLNPIPVCDLTGIKY